MMETTERILWARLPGEEAALWFQTRAFGYARLTGNAGEPFAYASRLALADVVPLALVNGRTLDDLEAAVLGHAMGYADTSSVIEAAQAVLATGWDEK